MTIHQLIRHYANQLLQNETDFSQIRSELQFKDLDEEQITSTLRLIDSRVQRELNAAKERKKGREEFLLGALAFLVGIGITVVSVLGYVGNGKVMIFTWGVISFGAFKMFKGGFKMNTKAP